jgi:phage/plasmid primase-like uncharacterized protein
MSDVGQVVAQMSAMGLPPLPANHPVLDGKHKRFGPKKKAWYILRETTLRSGRRVVTGAFGYFQGENRNTVPVTIDFEEMTDEDRAELAGKQKAQAAKEAEEKLRGAELAANRARDQWQQAEGNPIGHPYLERKKITPEGVRVSDVGLLLIPMIRAGQIVGLQKIDQAGGKLYNKGMDKIGSACVLGTLAGAEFIAVGEGYATCRSVRMIAHLANDLPVVAAFDAGGIMPVAQTLRRLYPQAHLLFLADDDYQMEHRLIERLREDYNVFAAVTINGATQTVLADDGEDVAVTATWRTDANGIAYIEADVRKGRRVNMFKYENAGVSRCTAAAKAVGNASVVKPVFESRGDAKWTDFNDLHVEQSLDAVAAQIVSSIHAAQQPKHASPVPPAAPAVNAAELSVIPPLPRVTGAQPGVVPSGVRDVAGPAALPPPPLKADAEPGIGFVTLEWALAHCALVQGSTDVWDSLNKLRMKRPAFVAMVGKDNAKAWEGSAMRRSISPRNLPKTVRGVADETGGAGGDNIVMMLERYTLLYGTKTVWDHDKRKILGYDAMALARGNDLASRWLAHPLHMEKDLENLVFDPTQRVDLNTHINMFEGFPLTPRRDDAKAALALDLLYSLCATESDQEDVFKWVLRWLAFPLQNPGAKMQTGLLFFGERQGTGKSLFFEGIMKPMYGAHGATGGQNQLDSSYTMWRSQKLFVLFEEILSRQDKYSHFGLIKHMITGRDVAVSQKFKDDRTEANHMNCVMLSNEFQAIPLEPNDRRFLVVDVRNNLDAELLAKIKVALNDGLIEAFYHFLLTYPLDDFDEHTKPIMTAAKQRVINFGRPDWEAFYLAWAANELDAPYCSCLSNDLFLVYDRYCSRFKLRAQSLTKFGELMGNRLKKDRQWVTIGSKKKLLTVLHVPPEEGALEESLSKQCERFRDLADIRGVV